MLAGAGCQSMEPDPCDAENRAAQARQVQPMQAAVQDSIAQVFRQKNRIRQIALSQEACHFRAVLHVDSIATEEYAVAQVEALIRLLKKHAPNETAPLEEHVGEGIYDYVVVVRRAGEGSSGTRAASGEQRRRPMLKGAKLYNQNRVIWGED